MHDARALELEISTYTAQGELMNFTIRSGERVCLRGNNGTGKTAILSCIAGVPYHPQYAQMRRQLNGVDIPANDQDFAALIHWQGHRTGLAEGTSIQEEWLFWSQLMQESHSKTELEALAQKVAIITPLNQDVVSLSAGEKQKVALGRLFLTYRPIWLLDEPESHLDQRSISRLHHWIDAHCAQGGMVLYSSHTEHNTVREITLAQC